jgi:hypothetical protein
MTCGTAIGGWGNPPTMKPTKFVRMYHRPCRVLRFVAGPASAEHVIARGLAASCHRPAVDVLAKKWSVDVDFCCKGLRRADQDGQPHKPFGIPRLKFAVSWISVRVEAKLSAS